MERHQVTLYLGALAAGALAGLLLPGVEAPAGAAVTPVLALLLFATFLGVPFAHIGEALRDVRFLATVLAVNFVLAPAAAFAVSRLVAHDRALLVGVLFVLLTPCIDYVIVFTGLAGGARDRLLAAAPALMAVQMLLLPVYLRWFSGGEAVAAVDPRPFVEALLVLVVLPLLAAALVQAAAGRSVAGRPRGSGAPARAARGAMRGAEASMVPLMVVTLFAVVASQVASLGGRIAELAPVIPAYLLFAAVMLMAGALTARLAGLDTAGRRAVVFSGITRNSLVVLPLVLALPPAYDLAPLAVVAQTLVELLLMVVLIAVVPRLVRD